MTSIQTVRKFLKEFEFKPSTITVKELLLAYENWKRDNSKKKLKEITTKQIYVRRSPVPDMDPNYMQGGETHRIPTDVIDKW